MELHVVVVVECNAVEFKERVCGLVAWSCQSAIQWNTSSIHRPGSADINALALLDVPKIDRINSLALIRDNRWLHMANQSPLRCTEEGVSLNVGRTGAGT